MFNFPAPVMNPFVAAPAPQAPMGGIGGGHLGGISPALLQWITHAINSSQGHQFTGMNPAAAAAQSGLGPQVQPPMPQMPQVMPAPVPLGMPPVAPAAPHGFGGFDSFGSGGMPGGMDAGMGPRNLRRY